MGFFSTLFGISSKPKANLTCTNAFSGNVRLLEDGYFRIGDYTFDPETDLSEVVVAVPGVQGGAVRVDKPSGHREVLTIKAVGSETSLQFQFEPGTGWLNIS